MVRFRPVEGPRVGVRESIIERFRDIRDRHPDWVEWVTHWGAEVDRWELGVPVEIGNWQLPRHLRQSGDPSDRYVVDGEGLISPVRRGMEKKK